MTDHEMLPLQPTPEGLKTVRTASLEMVHLALCNGDFKELSIRDLYTVEAAVMVNAELEARR